MSEYNECLTVLCKFQDNGICNNNEFCNRRERSKKKITNENNILPTTVTATFTPDVSFMCFYCGQPHKVNNGETCKETVGARFDRLEKEIERLNNLLKNINL